MPALNSLNCKVLFQSFDNQRQHLLRQNNYPVIRESLTATISRALFLCGVCVHRLVRLRSSSIHRIWLRFPWLCAIFPTYTSFLGSRFCVWHFGAKQPFSFSLSKVPGLSFTLNQTLCLCLAWFTHSLLRSPQKRKKNPRESPGSNENRCYQKGSIVETVFNRRATSLF